jgi:hypothetical protein
MYNIELKSDNHVIHMRTSNHIRENESNFSFAIYNTVYINFLIVKSSFLEYMGIFIILVQSIILVHYLRIWKVEPYHVCEKIHTQDFICFFWHTNCTLWRTSNNMRHIYIKLSSVSLVVQTNETFTCVTLI